MIPARILDRTGARNTASVPADVLKLLNAGKIQSVNLCEWLVIDQIALAPIVFKELGWQEHLPAPKDSAKKMRILAVFPTKSLDCGSLLPLSAMQPAASGATCGRSENSNFRHLPRPPGMG